MKASRYFSLFTLYFSLLLLASCAVVSDLDSADGPGDWTIFRGSPSLDGYVERSLPANPKLQWTFRNDVRTVSSPIIYGGNAYTCDRKGVIRGIDKDGQKFFEHDLGTTVEASFVIRDSVMYVGRIDGFVTAFDLPTCKTLWEFETLGQISASPNLIEKDGGLQLLVGSYDNNMYTIDAFDGSQMSCFPSGYYINGAAALWQDYMVYGGCDAWLRIVNTQTGQQTDSLELNAYVPASPAIMDHFAYVSDYSGNLYEVEIEAGKFKKHRMFRSVRTNQTDSEGGVVSMPSVSPDAVYILSGDRRIRCFDRKSGKERWNKLLRGETGESAPIISRDKVLVCTKDGHVSILQTKDGSELWHFETGEQIIASPAVIDRGFYILTSRGKLFFFTEA